MTPSPDFPSSHHVVHEVATQAIGRAVAGLVLAVLAACAAPTRAHAGAAVVPAGFEDRLVVSGAPNTLGMAFLPDGRLLIAEKSGHIRLTVGGGFGAVDPLLAVDSVASTFLESGLLGIAVDPAWPARPYVYAFYCARDSTLRISRYRAGGALQSRFSTNLTLDPASRYELFRDLPDRNGSHNGGTVRFGPDGMLYVGLGDDTDKCSAQDTTTLRGVMLRLAVDGLPDGPGGPPPKSLLAPPDNPFANHPSPNARLVWALGLRNPFRFHIDRYTGEVFIADVGWGMNEEVDVADQPGLDFGWPYFEGTWPQSPACPLDTTARYVTPIHQYNRVGYQVAAVMSAGVYHATNGLARFPVDYEGDYFYSDFYRGFLRRLKRGPSGWSLADPVPGQPSTTDWGEGFQYVSDFLVGPDGGLWYCRCSPYADGVSEIREIIPTAGLAGVPARAPDGVVFAPPAPVPAHGPVVIAFTLEHRARVELALYDASGRRVKHLVPTQVAASGRHAPVWDRRDEQGRTVSPGVYLAVLSVDGIRLERRVPILQ